MFLWLLEMLQKRSFAENATGLSFVQLRYVLERTAPRNVTSPGWYAEACGMLKPSQKPSAEQQEVQGQRQDGVVGGPICQKE